MLFKFWFQQHFSVFFRKLYACLSALLFVWLIITGRVFSLQILLPGNRMSIFWWLGLLYLKPTTLQKLWRCVRCEWTQNTTSCKFKKHNILFTIEDRKHIKYQLTLNLTAGTFFKKLGNCRVYRCKASAALLKTSGNWGDQLLDLWERNLVPLLRNILHFMLWKMLQMSYHHVKWVSLICFELPFQWTSSYPRMLLQLLGPEPTWNHRSVIQPHRDNEGYPEPSCTDGAVTVCEAPFSYKKKQKPWRISHHHIQRVLPVIRYAACIITRLWLLKPRRGEEES